VYLEYISSSTQTLLIHFSAVFPYIIQRFEWETPTWCSQ